MDNLALEGTVVAVAADKGGNGLANQTQSELRLMTRKSLVEGVTSKGTKVPCMGFPNWDPHSSRGNPGCDA